VKSFKQFAAERRAAKLPVLDEVLITTDGLVYERLDESRKWVSGRFERNIGIDQPTSQAQASNMPMCTAGGEKRSLW